LIHPQRGLPLRCDAPGSIRRPRVPAMTPWDGAGAASWAAGKPRPSCRPVSGGRERHAPRGGGGGTPALVCPPGSSDGLRWPPMEAKKGKRRGCGTARRLLREAWTGLGLASPSPGIEPTTFGTGVRCSGEAASAATLAATTELFPLLEGTSVPSPGIRPVNLASVPARRKSRVHKDQYKTSEGGMSPSPRP